MGAVFEARHVGTGRRVAVKIIASESLSQNADVVSRFRREAMASGAIESQHIAHVMDTGVDPSSGKPYLVMELLVGEDLEQVLRRVRPFPPDLALRVVAQACLGLQRAHEQAVIHRDIKPANLFLARRDRDGAELVVKILDFGIAKMTTDQRPASDALTSTLTRTGWIVGSPLYVSPEQALGRKTIDHRTDIWSLGVVLYEALTGTAPHAHAESVGALVVSICHEPAALVQQLAPWVSHDVAAIVHQALAIDPAARFGSATEMLVAIRKCLPHGHVLDASMVVPIGSEARAIRQSPFVVPSALRLPAPASGPLESTADESGAMRSAGMAGSESGPPRTPRFARLQTAVVVAVALAAAILGIGAYAMTSRMNVDAAADLTARARQLANAEPSAGAIATAVPSAPVSTVVPVQVLQEKPPVGRESVNGTLETPIVSIDSLPRVVPTSVAPHHLDASTPTATVATSRRSTSASTKALSSASPEPGASVDGTDGF